MVLTVALTGLNATDSPGPGPGLGVARALLESRDDDVRLVGLGYDPLEPGFYVPDLLAAAYLLPLPGAGSEALLDRLTTIHARERLDIVIPCFDAELPLFVRLAPQLAALGIRTVLPTAAQLALRQKAALPAFGEQHGLRVPTTRVLTTVADLGSAGAALGWPLVVKGPLYEALVAHTVAQAEAAFYALLARWGGPVLAQQFLAGQELVVAGLADGAGNLLSVVPMRKLTLTDKGKAWAGITITDAALTALAATFAAASGWRGPFELELLRTTAGEVFVLEINPRFPAWIYLAAAAGANQPAALLRLARGEAVAPLPAPITGKMFVRAAWDLITDHTAFQQLAGRGER